MLLLVAALSSACSTQVPSATPAGASATAAPATATCRALDVKPGSGATFVAVAEGSMAVAFVLDAATGAARGRIELPSAVPEVALDGTGNQLVVLCENLQSPQLVAIDLDTLAERWRVGVTDAQTTKATGGLPSLGTSRDGNLVFLQHSKALRADADGPGGSRNWVSVHDAHNGVQMAEVELPECKAGSRLIAGAPATVTVICRDGARTAEAPTWRVSRTVSVPNLGPVTLIDDTRLLSVSTQLQVLGIDLRTGTTFEDSKWEQPAARVTHWGRLTSSTDGTRLWVLTAHAVQGSTDQALPDTLTEINLTTRKRTDTLIADLRGVGLIGTRVVYFVQGRLHSVDGGLDVPLLGGSVHYWRVLART